MCHKRPSSSRKWRRPIVPNEQSWLPHARHVTSITCPPIAEAHPKFSNEYRAGWKVTVGTAVASRPPYRSRRALLTHRAPPSGSGVEAVTRQRVYRSDWRKEAGDALDEPLPAEACRLAAPLERCEPEPLHLVEEPPQARVVARDSEVVQMPFQHLFHPSPGFRDGVVHYPAQLDHGRTTAPESLQPRAVWFHCARIAA